MFLHSLALLCSLLMLQQPATLPAADVSVLAPFVGEWAIEGKWDSGVPIVARNVNAWTLNDQHLSNKTFTGRGSEEAQRYETFMSYDTKYACLTSRSFAVDGACSEYRIDTEDGKTFKLGFTPLHKDHPSVVRQTIVFTDADTYTWKVEMFANGAWTQLIDGTWKRVKK